MPVSRYNGRAFEIPPAEQVLSHSPTRQGYFAPRYWMIHLGLGILRACAWLPYPAIIRLGKNLGRLVYHFSANRRRIAMTNLALCFPELDEAARTRLAKAHFRSAGIGMLELTTAWYKPLDKLRPWYEISGLEHLEAAREEGKGTLLLAFHTTCLEISGILLNRHRDLVAMYRPNNNPLFDRFIQDGRHNRLETLDRDDVRGVVRCLRKNGAVWYGADQDYGPAHSVFAPFFDIPAATLTATSRFVRIGGARVIPFTQYRDPVSYRLHLQIHPPLEPFGEDDTADAVTMNRFLEDFLRRHPEDYLWTHRRFKTRPEGMAPFYQKRARRRDTMTGRRFADLLRKHRALETDKYGRAKVLLTHDDEIIKLFYRRKKFSSDWWRPYAHRFVANADRLKALGFETVDITSSIHCPAHHCHLVRYPMIPGISARQALQSGHLTMARLGEFYARLHDQGVYFRAGHLGNILLTGQDRLALIDLVDCYFYTAPLTAGRSQRNLDQLLGYHKDRALLADMGLQELLDAYFRKRHIAPDKQPDYLPAPIAQTVQEQKSNNKKGME